MTELVLAKPRPEPASLKRPFQWLDCLDSADAGVPSCLAEMKPVDPVFRLNTTIWPLWIGATSDARWWRRDGTAGKRQRRRKGRFRKSIFLLDYSSCLESSVYYGNIH
jgi:hypothetical protein